MFLNCSTCFERHTAHHRELKNCNCSLWFNMTEPWQLPATPNVCKNQRLQLQFLSFWWWAVCRSKHVEQSRNMGIINSITRSHFFSLFLYDLYYDARIHEHQILFPASPLSRSLLFTLQLFHSTSALTICLHHSMCMFLPSLITCDNFTWSIKFLFLLYAFFAVLYILTLKTPN